MISRRHIHPSISQRRNGSQAMPNLGFLSICIRGHICLLTDFPELRYKLRMPAIQKKKQPGVRQVVYFPARLHKMLRFAAARENCPRTRIIIAALEKYFNGEKAVQ